MVAVEKDPQVALVLREQVKDMGNVIVVEGNVLKAPLPSFNKAIAIPPYYLSSNLATWLFERKVDCAVMILQQEFANRLVANVGSEDYGWLTVLTCLNAESELLDAVPKDMFYPQPEVDSVIIALKPWSKRPFQVEDERFFKQMVKWLFTQRNKKLGKALAPFLRSTLKLSKQDAEKLADASPFHDRRPRELQPQNFGVIADAITH